MFHITNGDCAAAALARAGIPDQDVLPWRDVLHEGPVPAGLALDELSSVRAAFIAQCGWGDLDTVREEFRLRDCRLAGLQAEHEAVLWFESDLYDQLQLIQLLDWFAEPAHRPQRLTLVCIDRDPDSGRFEGLGALSKERVAALLQARAAVTDEQLDLGRRAWAAFRAAAPGALEDLWRQDLRALPYLSEAILRWLQELPAMANGLSRTERTALEEIARQPRSREQVFRAVQAREERPFMGDWSFWRLLQGLEHAAVALLRRETAPAWPAPADAAQSVHRQVLALTAAGRAGLAGELDAVQVNGIDRWWGGTRLWRPQSVWRWDGAHARMVGPG
ncbi:MAG TPA: hypothetical protein VIA64_12045 [Burkholderiales bacterium]|jgi:hypothetical protein